MGNQKHGTTATGGWDAITSSRAQQLGASSTLAPLLAYTAVVTRDAAILKKSADLFRSTTTIELRATATNTSRPFPKESLHKLVINDHFKKMSDFHRPMIETSINATNRPITSRTNYTKYVKEFEKSLFSEHGVNLFKSVRTTLGTASAILTTAHIISSDDKVAAIRNQTSATLGSIALGSFSMTSAHAASGIARTAAGGAGGIIGGIVGAVTDESMEGKGLTSYLLSQSYFGFQDLAVIKPAYQSMTKSFADAAIAIKESGTTALLTEHESLFRKTLKSYNTNMELIRAKSSPIGTASAMSEPLFDLSKPTSHILADMNKRAPRTIVAGAKNSAPSVLRELQAHIENTGYMAKGTIKKLRFYSHSTLALGIGTAAWDISQAENKPKEAVIQTTTAAAGVMGGVGATASLALFSAAASPTVAVAATLCVTNPICVTGVAAVGAFSAAAIINAAWKFEIPPAKNEGTQDNLMTPNQNHYRKKY